jgi:hypothetical protein
MIHEEIKERFAGRKGWPASDIPLLRQVQRVVQDLTPRDQTAPWSLGDADPDEVRAVLDVLVDVALESDGRVVHFTVREASWIARVRRAAPTLNGLSVRGFAREYMLRQDAQQSAADLDLALATGQRMREGTLPRPSKTTKTKPAKRQTKRGATTQ